MSNRNRALLKTHLDFEALVRLSGDGDGQVLQLGTLYHASKSTTGCSLVDERVVSTVTAAVAAAGRAGWRFEVLTIRPDQVVGAVLVQQNMFVFDVLLRCRSSPEKRKTHQKNLHSS
jgi:hypothetical protein